MFTLVLIVLILLQVTTATLLETNVGHLIVGVLLFIVSLFLAIAFIHRGFKFWLYVIAAFITIMVDNVRFFELHGALADNASITAGIGYFGLVLIALVLMTRQIVEAKSVTRDIMIGSICVYFTLGFVWYITYATIYELYPASFRGVGAARSEFELLYFSFNTLTTLGHGDIVPVSNLAMVLCNLEAICGQMFPAIFVARLVSLFVINQPAVVVETPPRVVEPE